MAATGGAVALLTSAPAVQPRRSRGHRILGQRDKPPLGKDGAAGRAAAAHKFCGHAIAGRALCSRSSGPWLVALHEGEKPGVPYARTISKRGRVEGGRGMHEFVVVCTSTPTKDEGRAAVRTTMRASATRRRCRKQAAAHPDHARYAHKNPWTRDDKGRTNKWQPGIAPEEWACALPKATKLPLSVFLASRRAPRLPRYSPRTHESTLRGCIAIRDVKRHTSTQTLQPGGCTRRAPSGRRHNVVRRPGARCCIFRRVL